MEYRLQQRPARKHAHNPRSLSNCVVVVVVVVDVVVIICDKIILS